MKKFILKRLLPWLKENVKIEVEYTTGKLHCIDIKVHVAGFELINEKGCKVQK